MNRVSIVFAVFIALSGVVLHGAAAPSKAPQFDKPTAGSNPLFADRVVARGKGFEIKQSQVEDMYLSFKGHRAALGQAIPDGLRPQIEADIIDKLIATQLFLRRATDDDKAKAKQIAKEFLDEQRKQTASEDSFRRQLMGVGMTTNQFEAQIREQAIVKAVIDREIKATRKISDEDARKFYDSRTNLFQEPELVRAAHILIPTRDTVTGKPLAPEAKLQKKRVAESLVTRARAGEDFAKLVQEFSADAASKSRGGEYTFARSKDDPRRAMAPEFEAAAFSMKANQVSDVVETGFGYHVIKTLEKIPARRIPYSQLETRIKETLLRDAVEKELPNYIERLRREAGVEILTADAAK